VRQLIQGFHHPSRPPTAHRLRHCRTHQLSAKLHALSSALVGDLDPITISAAVGIDAKALIYYLDEAPSRDHDPVQLTTPTRRLGSA